MMYFLESMLLLMIVFRWWALLLSVGLIIYLSKQKRKYEELKGWINFVIAVLVILVGWAIYNISWFDLNIIWWEMGG